MYTASEVNALLALTKKARPSSSQVRTKDIPAAKLVYNARNGIPAVAPDLSPLPNPEDNPMEIGDAPVEVINVTLPPEAALSTALNVNSTAKQAKQKSLGAKKKYGSTRRAQMPTN